MKRRGVPTRARYPRQLMDERYAVTALAQRLTEARGVKGGKP